MTATAEDSTVAAFIARWREASGTELANCQLLVVELTRLLDAPTPEPAREDTRDNAYVFERRVTLAGGDGGSSEGRIDCYRRGARKRLPPIVESLEALGRVQISRDGTAITPVAA